MTKRNFAKAFASSIGRLAYTEISQRASTSLICLCLLITSCAAQPAVKNATLEGQWQLEMTHKDIGVVRTSMNFITDAGTFEAYTRKNADKDILGSWTSMLGRAFTKNFKDGSLLRIEKGIFATRNDTLRWAGIFSSAMGRFNIEGYIADTELVAHIRNGNRNYVGTLKGHRKRTVSPLEDYPALFEESIQLTQDKIYNKAVLTSDEWKKFVKSMRSVSPKMQDDLEMVFAFFYYAGKLPISHYALMKISEPDTVSRTYKQELFLEEKEPQTAYLKINSFQGSAAEMDSIFSIIKTKNYHNLIVDLRDNAGGSIEAGMTFVTNIADTTFYGGIFLTQKYFNRHNAPPASKDYVKFPHFTEANFDLIIEGIHKTEGLCLKVVPKQTTYKGRVYLLINSHTASTCEPIVYGLKQRNRATVIGERTAGAMLNGEIFHLNKGFSMIIPTADYFTSDGYRIDQNGVKPGIEIKHEQALDYVTKNLLTYSK